MRGTHSTFEIDASLRRVAQDQLGLITVAQAAKAGVDTFALARRRKVGALVPVFADVMRLGSVEPTPLQPILAASLAVPGSTIAATSAAVVHGMPVQSLGRPVLTVSPAKSARVKGITAIRTVAPLPNQPWMTTRVATPAATLVLLPRFVSDRMVERCLDHCLANGLTTVEKVSELVEQTPARAVHGRRLLVELLADRSTGIGHRSGLEQRVAPWLDAAGLRGWQRNFDVPVGEAHTVEVDFGWPELKVALEVSPFFTHGSREKQERDAQRRRLLIEQNWRIVEATDPDLENKQAFARTVSALKTLLRAA
jgi:very-short-patch-repair endonuclease